MKRNYKHYKQKERERERKLFTVETMEKVLQLQEFFPQVHAMYSSHIAV